MKLPSTAMPSQMEVVILLEGCAKLMLKAYPLTQDSQLVLMAEHVKGVSDVLRYESLKNNKQFIIH